MPNRRKEREYAATPMGEMFRVGIKPVRAFFNKMAQRAESTFWNMNNRMNGGLGHRGAPHVPDDKQ
jgi:hypothetical protein